MSSERSAILIRGGRIIDPASGLDETGDLLIEDGRVRAISTNPRAIQPPEEAQVIDAEGCIVAPGLIDLHVHLREPSDYHEETIATGSASAINGGFTTVCCMPNTTPPLDTPESIRFVMERGADAHGARIFAVGCGTVGRKGEQPAPIRAMCEAGAVSISDDGDCIASAGVMLDVLREVRAADSCFMQHCQDPTLTRGASMNAGPVAERLGQIGWPRVAEEIIIERDVRLNLAVGARYHVQHISSGASAAIVRQAQHDGQPVTCEVSPHHLLLTDDACARGGAGDANTKMNPPLRTQRDIDELLLAVADGTITVFATDHAPHPAGRKNVAFEQAAFGIVGLDCALPLYIRALIEPDVIDWQAMLAMMTIHPARLTGLDRLGLGSLAESGPGDVTIIDPTLEWTIEPSEFASRGRNCPFGGWKVAGRSIATMVGGETKLLRTAGRISSV